MGEGRGGRAEKEEEGVGAGTERCFQGEGCPRTLCPVGTRCTVKIEWFGEGEGGGNGYSGLFKRADHGVIRLSSSIKPPAMGATGLASKALLYAMGRKLREAKLFPFVALKLFRGSAAPTGNVLFAGCKTGQPESNFFAHWWV